MSARDPCWTQDLDSEAERDSEGEHSSRVFIVKKNHEQKTLRHDRNLSIICKYFFKIQTFDLSAMNCINIKSLNEKSSGLNVIVIQSLTYNSIGFLRQKAAVNVLWQCILFVEKKQYI